MNSAEQPYTNRQEHLSEKQLMRYDLGQMDGAEMQRVEQHLLDCELCSDALEGLALLQAQEAEEAVQDIRERLSKRINGEHASSRPGYWRWGIAASILLLFTSGLFLLFQDGGPGDQLLVETEGSSPNQQELPVPAQAEEPDTFPNTEAIAAEAEEDTSLPEEVQPENLATRDDATSSRQYAVAEPEQKPETVVSEPIAETREETLTEALDIDLDMEESLTEEIIFEAEPELAEVVTTKADTQPSLAKKGEESKGFRNSLTDTENKREIRSLNLIPSKNLQGKVTDTAGEPLPGVNVRLKGSTQGTLTDEKGEFALRIPFADTSLTIQAIGFVQKEVPVKDTAQYAHSVLQEDVLALEEVIVKEAPSARTAGTRAIPPQPVSGWKAFRKYLKEQQIYPVAAKEAGVEGTVELTFTVLPNGSLEDFRLVKSLGYGLDEEAIRLVKNGPEWQPAASEKEPVAKKASVQVHFTLE